MSTSTSDGDTLRDCSFLLIFVINAESDRILVHREKS